MAELNLRVVRQLDADISPALREYLLVKEGSDEWVDNDIARDFTWTYEIMEKTAGFGVADDEGNILATFDTLEEAESARGRARIQFSLVLDEDAEDAPRAGVSAPVALGLQEALSTNEALEPAN